MCGILHRLLPPHERYSFSSSFLPTVRGIMCGILAVLGCADWSQAKRARILTCSRRQALVHCTVKLGNPLQ
uniref:Uncharacterized protein n=1 Tax=Arundo donax TaxID=35708 RepID=A0A0A9D1X6_ARUDO